MKRLWKFRVFALEMVIGGLIGVLGLLQLLLKVRVIPIAGDAELMEKIAAALVTIGGTVLLSGIFRFAFSVRLDETEQRILDSLLMGRRAFTKTIENFQPKGYSPRPDQHFMACRHLYWRTKDAAGTPMWLHFAPIDWQMGVLPFLEAQGRIDHPRFGPNFAYHLAMVRLQRCLVIAATRIDGAADTEITGVYVLFVPVEPAKPTGFLRHMNMAGDQSLSACLLSTSPIADTDLEPTWLAGSGKDKVDRNFPLAEGLASPVAAA
jgi:hypothetical protein